MGKFKVYVFPINYFKTNRKPLKDKLVVKDFIFNFTQ